MKKYYKAYDERYKQVYKKYNLWETSKYTGELLNVIEKLNINKSMKILDLGCGEGRDSIKLLNEGYNVLALDYSNTVINKCNKITNNKYKNNFKQFDILEDTLNIKYDFIYSIALLHMFVLDSDRNKFWSFIKEHLKDNGYAFIITMGDGIKEYKSDINDAFKLKYKKMINYDEEIFVVNTSCRIVSFNNIEKEIKNNNLEIVDKYISNNIPNFDKVMCVIVKKCDIISHG